MAILDSTVTVQTANGQWTALNVGQLVVNLNADKLDGKHAREFASNVHTHHLADITDFSWPEETPIYSGVVDEPSFTDNGDGTITIGPGTYNFRSAADWTSRVYQVNIQDKTFTPTDGVVSYVYADWASGTPQLDITTNHEDIQLARELIIFTVYREGTSVHVLGWDEYADGLAERMHNRFIKTVRYARESGILLTESATRVVNISAGKVWHGVVRDDVPVYNSSIDPWRFVYYNGSSWVYDMGTTQYNNSQYNDPTSGLVALPDNRWTINWIYRSAMDTPNCAAYVLGPQSYGSIEEAEDAQPPSNLPDIISKLAFLVGRIIVQKGASSGIVESAYDATFVSRVSTWPNIATGIISFGGLSQNALDHSKFDIGAVQGWIVDNITTPDSPTVQYIDYAGATGITLTYLLTHPVTYIGLAGNTTADIVQSTTPFTSTQWRNVIKLGVVVHSDHATVITTNIQPNVVSDDVLQFYDLVGGLGKFNLSTNGVSGNVFSAGGANLTVNKTAGSMFSPGSNYLVDPRNPHVKTTGAQTPVTFRYRLQNSTEYANTTTVDPNNYDVGGVFTTVPKNKYTIQRIALFESNLSRWQYGQNLYDSLDDAEAALPFESFAIEANIAGNGLIRGFLIVKQGCTDLSDPLFARFVEADRWGVALNTTTGDVRFNDILRHASTGLVYFTGLSKNAVDGTKFDIGTAGGWIVDNTTDPGNPALNRVHYDGSIHQGMGTVTTNGTVNLVGYDTTFSTSFVTGDTITVDGETVRIVDTVTDDTHLSVTVAFSTSGAGKTYICNPSGIALTYLLTHPVTYIGLTGNTRTDIVQQTTPFTWSQLRDIIRLGVVVHSTHSTIVTTNNQPVLDFNPVLHTYDLMSGLGKFNVPDGTPGNIFSANGANLKIDKSAGKFFSPGCNYLIDPKNPHVKTMPSATAITFRYRLQDSTEYTDTTDVDPNYYDNAGVKTAVPLNKFTVQRIALFESNISRWQYGQNLYDSIDDAEASIPNEPFVVEPNIGANGLVRSYLVIKQGCTDLTDTKLAKFVVAGRWGLATETVPGNVHRTDILNSLSTGLRNGGVISAASSTTFNVTAGVGIIVDNHTDPNNPEFKEVIWPTYSGVSLPYLASSYATIIMINELGAIEQIPISTYPSQHDKRDKIILGGIGHPSHTAISNIYHAPQAFVSPANQLEDLASSIGPFSITGNIAGAVAGTLRLAKTEGTSYMIGGNFQSSSADPSKISCPALTGYTAPIIYSHGTDLLGATGYVVDPEQYDPSGLGILAPAPISKFITHRIWHLPINNFLCFQYGQNAYAQLIDAVNGVSSEAFVSTPYLSNFAYLVAVLVIKQGCTDLSNSTRALFIPMKKFTSTGGGGAGGGGTSIHECIEIPAGLINGVNKLFTTSHTYLAGTTKVFHNGLKQILTVDYTEDAGYTTFTMTNAPLNTGYSDTIEVIYDYL